MAKASVCMNNLKQTGLGGFLMYASDYNEWIYTAGTSQCWAQVYSIDSTHLPYGQPYVWGGTWTSLGYITNNSQFVCPTAPPYSNYSNPGSSWSCYGVTTPFCTVQIANAGGTSNTLYYAHLPRLKKPSNDIGTIDSVNCGGGQCVNVYPASSALNDPVYARYHLRHNGRANTWLFDGHVEPYNLDNLSYACSINYADWGYAKDTFIYAQNEKNIPVFTKVK